MRFFTTKTPLKPERTLASICKDFATDRYLPYHTTFFIYPIRGDLCLELIQLKF